MNQARRKKRYKKRSSRRKPSAVTSSGWAMLAIGLISGAILAALVFGARDANINFGGGLKNLYDKHQGKRDRQTVIKPAQTAPKKKPAPKFDYYTVLPEYEQVLPEDYSLRPKRQAEKADKKYQFIVQAASFNKHSDADQLKALLALNGIEANIQKISIEGKGTFFRVRAGPFKDYQLARNSQQKISKHKVKPVVLKLSSNPG